jgi:hypothetical protein
MKKLFVIVAAVMVSSAAFSQDTKTTAPSATTAAAKPASSSSSTHGCYMMKDNKLMHMKGDAMTPVKSDVKLKNGTMISTKGEITAKDGTKSMLANGQCCDMSGHVGDCDKMKASMTKAATPAPAPAK